MGGTRSYNGKNTLSPLYLPVVGSDTGAGTGFYVSMFLCSPLKMHKCFSWQLERKNLKKACAQKKNPLQGCVQRLPSGHWDKLHYLEIIVANPDVWSLTQHLNSQHLVNSSTISARRLMTEQTQRWFIFSHTEGFWGISAR